ncbi:MAG: cyclic nucleotide-binding domain-containing protein [Mariprofundaceae bacterium]|nr:cyclic nucleotide-binding domain-containing protein [Mariprofundaceae bacterium]
MEKKIETYDDFNAKVFPYLAVLNETEMLFLREIAEPLDVPANTEMIQEGQPPHALFLVRSGHFIVSKLYRYNVFEVGSITAGDIIGEASVSYNMPANAEIRSVTDSQVYRIDGGHLSTLFEKNKRFLLALIQLGEQRSAATAVAINPIFSQLPQAARETLLYNSRVVNLEAGDILIHENDRNTKNTYLVINGHAKASIQSPENINKCIICGRLGPGDEVGELVLVTNQMRSATVIATSSMSLIMIKNNMIKAWQQRYSDFANSLYSQVKMKLQYNFAAMREILGEQKAYALTLRHLPPRDQVGAQINSKDQSKK